MRDILLGAIAVLLLLTSGYFGYQYLTHREAGEINGKAFFKMKAEFIPACVMGAASMLSLAALFYCWNYGGDTFMRSFMNAEVLLFLILLGYIDFREKIIPNGLIGMGVVFWMMLVLIDVFVAKTPWLPLIKNSLLGGAVVGGVMLVIALVVKSALGMGDVKLFFVLGLLYGAVDTYSILLFSIIVMAIVSLVLLAIKKVNTKTAIPMAPFVAIGFALCIIAGM